ncbi:MAG TPA: type I-E CRISPR-associated protein Cse2/CasB [Gemmatimonadaceae bacterium]|nr:type I-E CRISPR-associated protein Cse2/CasB [Gemmatimonadaceae bacterium]
MTDAIMTSAGTTSNAESPDQAQNRATPGDRALDWWRQLTDRNKGDPGSLARLRRCRSSVDASTVRAAVSLARRLGATRQTASDDRRRDVLDLARVLAHVKEHDSTHPMRAAGWQRFAGDRKESDAGDDRPRLAEARFRRLLQTGLGEEKVAAFARLVALLGETINVRELANDFLDWNHPVRGDRVRERWAFIYYHADSALPAEPPEDSSAPHADSTATDSEDDA